MDQGEKIFFFKLGLVSVEDQHVKTEHSLILPTQGDVVISCNICTTQRVLHVSDNLIITSISIRNIRCEKE